jgi:hypothetical protein
MNPYSSVDNHLYNYYEAASYTWPIILDARNDYKTNFHTPSSKLRLLIKMKRDIEPHLANIYSEINISTLKKKASKFVRCSDDENLESLWYEWCCKIVHKSV